MKTALEKRRDLVAQVLPAQQGPPGTRLDVVLRGDPFATATFDQVPALRRTVKAAGGSSVLVGGPTAEAYDYRKSATRDNFVVLPLALIVVLVILAILLRSLLAPVLLVASVILSFFAALGTGIFFFEHVFGFAGRRPLAAAARVRLPRRAGDRLQHLPDGARARGDAARTARARACCAGSPSPARSSPRRASCWRARSARSPCSRSSSSPRSASSSPSACCSTRSSCARWSSRPSPSTSARRIWWPSRLAHEDGSSRRGR